MATPNYGYEKRQRELAKKKKKEDKLRAKANGTVVRHSDTYVAPDNATEVALGSAASVADNSTQQPS